MLERPENQAGPYLPTRPSRRHRAGSPGYDRPPRSHAWNSLSDEQFRPVLILLTVALLEFVVCSQAVAYGATKCAVMAGVVAGACLTGALVTVGRNQRTGHRRHRRRYPWKRRNTCA